MADEDTAPDEGATPEVVADEGLDSTTVEQTDDSEATTTEGDDETVVEDDSTPPKTHSITLDGTEIEVTEAELINGYLRQSDYTRKTQTLAEQQQNLKRAEAFWNAYQDDPEGTVTALQEHLAEALGDQGNNEVDPEEARIRELEQFKHEQTSRAAQQELDQAITELQSVHGDFDKQELLQFAVDAGIPNLEAALLLKREVTKRDAKSVKDAEEAQRLAAKRGSGVVQSGGSRAAGAQQSGSGGMVGSIEEAFADAKRELKL